MKFINIILLSLLLCAPASLAREKVDINFSNLQIDEFIKLIGKITQTNILVSQRIPGTVNLITTTPVYDDEVIGILISVLESKGFTLVRNGSVLEVVRSTEAAKSNVRVLHPEKAARGSMMVTQIIPVEGENVDIVAAKIRYLISKAAKLMTMKESNTILITDYPANIETVKKVVGAIGTKMDMTMKIVPVGFAELKKLQQQVTEIAKGIFNQKVETEKVTILANNDVNALILIGQETNCEKLASIIAELDKEQNLSEAVQIFSLKNSDAAAVAKSLNDIVSKQTFSDPSMKPNISSNEEINAVIVVGNPTVIKGIMHIIDELDKEKYQVYVQARIVEISNSDSEKIGIKYGMEGGVVNSNGLHTFAANFGGASVASETIKGMLEGTVSGIDGSLGNTDQLLILGAALDFLQSKQASKTVSNPSILCVNNQESSIYVGKTISFQTGTAISTGSVQTNSFKREDVGLTLKIKPRVSSEDKVTLDVEGILENAVGVDGNQQPITTKQTVKTQSILRHGESIIIGGLVKTYDTETVKKVPILGDIPLLGALFRHNDVQEQQDSLLVILTPYVIAQSEKLSVLQEQLGELGRLQQMYNEEVFPIIEKRAQQGLPEEPAQSVESDF